MILTFRPIKVWPNGWDREDHGRSSPFTNDYRSTLELLQYELERLDASDPIVQLAVNERACKMDGSLRSDARVEYRGCILGFRTAALGTLTYPCNAYAGAMGRPGWHENLRAVALGLKALRQLERYGIANRGQQYAGWAELPSGIAMGGQRAKMTVDEAARILSEGSIESPISGRALYSPDDVLSDEDKRKAAFRIAAKALHPDAGGDPVKWSKVEEAKRVLDELAA